MNDSEYTISDYRKAACCIVCPLCDKVICEGRFECPQINKRIEKMMKVKGEKMIWSTDVSFDGYYQKNISLI